MEELINELILLAERIQKSLKWEKREHEEYAWERLQVALKDMRERQKA